MLIHIYSCRVRPKIACLREAANLLDLDRDERKLDAFLQLHKSDLLVSDLRIFLPFTINLDPYLRKVLKEDQQALEDEGIIIPIKSTMPIMKPHSFVPTRHSHQSILHPTPQHPQSLPTWAGFYNAPPSMAMMNYYNHNLASLMHPDNVGLKKTNSTSILIDHPNDNHSNGTSSQSASTKHHSKNPSSRGSPPIDFDISNILLDKLTVEELIDLLARVGDLKPALDKLSPILRENAISGRVLTYCSLDELKSVLNLSFGHWEIFKMLILQLRENNANRKQAKTTTFAKSVGDSLELTDSIPTSTQSPAPSSVFQPVRQKSHMEKQVSEYLHTAYNYSFGLNLNYANQITRVWMCSRPRSMIMSIYRYWLCFLSLMY